MDSSNNQMHELSDLVREVIDKLNEEYYLKFLEFLNEIGISEDDDPFPLEIWMGIVQALADTCGFRVVLQAVILEPVEGEPDILREVGYQDVGAANPLMFVNRA